MMRLTEGILFFALATGIHAGIWHLAPASTGSSASGNNGKDGMTLAAATPAQAAMVKRWRLQPEVSHVTPDAPFQSASGPQTASFQTSAIPDMTRPSLAPVLEAPRLAAYPPESPFAQIDTTPAAPPLAQDNLSKVRPKARPPVPQAQRSASTQAQPKRRASGQGKQAQRGTAGADQTQSENSKLSNALRAKWGAQIHAKVQRNMRYPRGAAGNGTAKLALKVTPSGKLKTLSVMRSSGNAMLDKAAIQAVQRAGRFAKAPQELKDTAYAFSLSLTFSR